MDIQEPIPDAEAAPGVLEKTELSGAPARCEYPAENVVKGEQGSPPGQPTSGAAAESKGKSLSFYLSVLLLGVVGFLVALDANSLAVALPVRLPATFQGLLTEQHAFNHTDDPGHLRLSETI